MVTPERLVSTSLVHGQKIVSIADEHVIYHELY